MSKAPEAPSGDQSDHHEARLAKLGQLKAAGEQPYKLSFDRTDNIADLAAAHAGLEPGVETGLPARVAGRLIILRRHGKLAFADLRDGGGQIQLVVQADVVGEALEAFAALDPGDWIGAWGEIITTKRGQLSIRVAGFSLLSKCLRPLPEKWHGLKDTELRHRQRYVDLIASPEARAVLKLRSQTVAALRTCLAEQNFLEVETPMLQPIAGGALARPFTTFHEALDMPLYLRVAPELYLKRLLVGGVERVFEVNKSFRNEGVSVRHNPEFTMLELYQAFADYNDMAGLMEGMIRTVCDAVGKDQAVAFQGAVIDFHSPFRRARLIDLVAEAGVDTSRDLRAECERLQVPVDPSWPWGKLLLELYEKKVERNLIQPTFVMDFPKEVSPLAREHRSDPRFTEHLDLVIAGMEVGVAYSELTDPIEQRHRFEEQIANRDKSEEVAADIDEDFLRAMEYGMPPAGGLGFGIDRFVMVLADQASIREVILFPALRPEAQP